MINILFYTIMLMSWTVIFLVFAYIVKIHILYNPIIQNSKFEDKKVICQDGEYIIV